MKKYFGFTLAEFMATLAIVGVIAALTVPTLMKNSQSKILVTKLKKTIAVVTVAIENVMDETHSMTLAETGIFGSQTAAHNFLKNYFKTSSTSLSDPTDFIASSYDKVSSRSSFSRTTMAQSYTCAKLKDDSSICLKPNADKSGAELLIDTNGLQGPNIEGYDLFLTKIESNGDIVSYEESTSTSSSYYNKNTAYSRIVKDGWELKY